MEPVTLGNIADKAANELFSHELDKVMRNIDDPNTSAKGKRKLTLSFTFEPDADRHEVKTTVEVKSTLTPVKSYTKTSFLGKANGRPTLFGTDHKQIEIFNEGVTQLADANEGTNG